MRARHLVSQLACIGAVNQISTRATSLECLLAPPLDPNLPLYSYHFSLAVEVSLDFYYSMTVEVPVLRQAGQGSGPWSPQSGCHLDY